MEIRENKDDGEIQNVHCHQEFGFSLDVCVWGGSAMALAGSCIYMRMLSIEYEPTAQGELIFVAVTCSDLIPVRAG